MKLLYAFFGLLASTTALAQVGGPGVSAPGTGGASDTSDLMKKDASNATLPAARNNLELGTVRSEGGTSPNADNVTRFYTFEGGIQYGVNSNPHANEYAVEQAGLGAPGGVGIGHGATRICTAPYSNNAVNCNFVATGRDGKHLFGSGAGPIVEFQYRGSGAANNDWLRLGTLGGDSGTLMESLSWSGGANMEIRNSNLILNNEAYGSTTFRNGQGVNLTVSSGTVGVNNAHVGIIGTSAGFARIYATDDVAFSADLELAAQRFGSVSFRNGQGVNAKIGSGTLATTNTWPQLLGSNDGTSRILTDSELPNAPMYIASKGNSAFLLGNGAGTIARFNNISGTGDGYLDFTMNGTGGGSSILTTNPTDQGLWIRGQRTPGRQTGGAFTIALTEIYSHFFNTGAVTTTFTLPAAAPNGVNYCFTVDVGGGSVVVKASGSDKIAIGTSISVAGGTATATLPYASLCLISHGGGTWITMSTSDKTLWTVT